VSYAQKLAGKALSVAKDAAVQSPKTAMGVAGTAAAIYAAERFTSQDVNISSPMSEEEAEVQVAKIWAWRVKEGDLQRLVVMMRNKGIINAGDSLSEIVRKVQAVNQWNNPVLLTLVDGI